MKLSTKGRYGVKAMLDLALHIEEGCISLKSVAQRQDISENYLEQLFALLRKAELVKSIRGSQGGYMLSKEPENIRVGDILRASEGSLTPVDCVDEKNVESCSRNSNCATKIIWEKMRDTINNVVDSITLNDLVNEYKSVCKNEENYIYYI